MSTTFDLTVFHAECLMRYADHGSWGECPDECRFCGAPVLSHAIGRVEDDGLWLKYGSDPIVFCSQECQSGLAEYMTTRA